MVVFNLLKPESRERVLWQFQAAHAKGKQRFQLYGNHQRTALLIRPWEPARGHPYPKFQFSFIADPGKAPCVTT